MGKPKVTTKTILEQKELLLNGLCNEDLVLVYDLETTGVRSCDRILQVAVRACLVSESGVFEIDAKNWYINPEIPIPSGATAVNGITDEFIADKPKENEVFDEIREYFGQYPVVGYNNDHFDNRMMSDMYERHGAVFAPKASYDLYPACVAFIPAGETPNCKLVTVTEYFGHTDKINKFHDAGGDTLATELIMESIIKGFINKKPESTAGKIKVELISVASWMPRNGRKRLYANCKNGDKELSFFVDVSNMRWDLKPEKNGASPAIPLDAYDIDDVARQVDERIKMPYRDFEGKA